MAVVTVVVNAGSIDAVDDTPSAINGSVGGTIPNIVANDTLNSVANPAIGTEVTLAGAGDTAVTPATTLGLDVTPAAGSITLNTTTGEIVVAAGTTAGTYLYTYEICEVLNPANCDVAVVTVEVIFTQINAIDDVPPIVVGVDGAVIPAVVGNDSLNGATNPGIGGTI